MHILSKNTKIKHGLKTQAFTH